MLGKPYDSLLTVFYPQSCEVCNNSVEESANGVACKRCWNETRIFTPSDTLCFKCGRYLNKHRSSAQADCHQCAGHFYENARAIGSYEGALAVSILRLKQDPYICRTLKQLLIKRSEAPLLREASLVVPIPLSKSRMIKRGFNQAQVLTKIVSEHLRIKTDLNSLVRTKHSKVHRAGMDRKAREMSVKKSFEVRRKKRISGENVLLIDDVLTSGATVSSCAKELKAAGAAKVYVLTLARAA